MTTFSQRQTVIHEPRHCPEDRTSDREHNQSAVREPSIVDSSPHTHCFSSPPSEVFPRPALQRGANGRNEGFKSLT